MGETVREKYLFYIYLKTKFSEMEVAQIIGDLSD